MRHRRPTRPPLRMPAPHPMRHRQTVPRPASSRWKASWATSSVGSAETFGSAVGRSTDALTDAGIIDLTAQSDKSLRKGARDLKKVKQLVLHQMACCFKPADPLKRFLTINAHFAITADGRILQLHPIEQLLWASNGFNGSSVAVEFAGNFPDTKGHWWEGAKYGKDRPTQAQFEAGRRLIRYLVNKIGLTQVVAHRQSSASRENDPGPEVWRNVGQWAVDTLGLSDGGAGFKLPGGNPIPDDWRKGEPRNFRHDSRDGDGMGSRVHAWPGLRLPQMPGPGAADVGGAADIGDAVAE